MYDYDLRIYEDFTALFQMSISFNFSLLYLLMVAYYNSNILIVKLVGDDGIEPPQADSKSAALPLCKSPVKLVQ